jgi:hypothetical protein
MTIKESADLCVGELYRDDNGHEMWRIKESETSHILREGISSDHDYKWLLDAFNHGEEYADQQQALRDAAASPSEGKQRPDSEPHQ